MDCYGSHAGRVTAGGFRWSLPVVGWCDRASPGGGNRKQFMPCCSLSPDVGVHWTPAEHTDMALMADHVSLHSSTVAVRTDLSNSQPRRQVGVDKVIASGSIYGVMDSKLVPEPQDV